MSHDLQSNQKRPAIRSSDELREDGEKVSFGKVKGEAADVDVAGVFELVVPRSDIHQSLFKLQFVQPLDVPHVAAFSALLLHFSDTFS